MNDQKLCYFVKIIDLADLNTYVLKKKPSILGMWDQQKKKTSKQSKPQKYTINKRIR